MKLQTIEMDGSEAGASYRDCGKSVDDGVEVDGDAMEVKRLYSTILRC